jgi:hypothetical protein
VRYLPLMCHFCVESNLWNLLKALIAVTIQSEVFCLIKIVLTIKATFLNVTMGNLTFDVQNMKEHQKVGLAVRSSSRKDRI